MRRLAFEELVIEKGGIPVAVLSRYTPGSAEVGVEAAYQQALARRAEPRGWERMDAAVAAGWAGLDAEEMVANIYRRREEAARQSRHFDFNVEEPEDDDDSGLPPGQRRLLPRDTPARFVADGDDSKYQA